MTLFQRSTQTTWGLYAVLLLTLAGTLTACRDNATDGLTPQDSQVYITNYDRSVNFSQYKTFSLPDSVLVQSNDRVAAVRGDIENQFVTNVAAALQSKGFLRVAKGQPADMGVAIIRVNNRYTGVGTNSYGSYYSNYWLGGFGGGLGGYGYNPYYPSYYTYQVSEQYWEIQMVDLKNRPPATGPDQVQLSVIFDATIRGGDVATTQDVDVATTAIFAQSPYLTASK